MTKIDHGAVAAAEHGIKRSPRWHSVEKAFLAANRFCLACGPGIVYPRGLQVHHAIVPFHYAILLGRGDLELDPRNLCVLCEDEQGVTTQDHHILVGHLENFQSYNPDVLVHASTKYRGRSKSEIKADPDFIQACKHRPKVWGVMSAQEKTDMKAMLDRVLPRAEGAKP